MGNRATVVFTNKTETKFSPSVYLHWNGGPESVYQFLDELDRRDVRADQDYECARFIAIVAQFMDQDYYGGLSPGVTNGPATLKEVAAQPQHYGLNNGTYLVCRDGDVRTVRRFGVHRHMFADGSGDGEMPQKQVKAEREAAYRNDYSKGGGFLKSVFAKGGKLTENEHSHQNEWESGIHDLTG